MLLGVSAFDRGSDGPDRDRPAEVTPVDNPVKQGRADAAVDSRSRGEAYADSRQYADSGWDRHRTFDPPRAELAAFRMERAGLAEITQEDADRYVEQNRAGRPWLQAAERASPEARRIIAAMDQGGGHGHIRHEGWATEEAVMRRAAYLEDPAQLDPEKKLQGIDGLKVNNKKHICADLATRITNPDAFATAFTRGVEHEKVRQALDEPYYPDAPPVRVKLSIADLLGSDGHKFCTGWQLQPADESEDVADSMDTARDNRHSWRASLREGRQPDVQEPSAQPVPSFEGGEIAFTVGHNKERDGFTITTLFAEPPDDPDVES